MQRPFPLAVATLVGLGCTSGGGSPTDAEPRDSIVVSGTLDNRSGAAIPGTARLLAAWTVVTTSPDYTYIFGEGVIDRTAGTFRLELPAPPPSQAHNNNGIAIAILAITTNQNLGTGNDIITIPEGEIIGASGQHAVIYLARDPDEVGSTAPWIRSFPRGYSVGRGIDLPGVFDGFEPANASSVVIVIDDFENIDFVNWF